MKNQSIISTKTPSVILFVEQLYKEWGCSMDAALNDKNSATIKCKTPFTLGLLVGHIMNRWLHDGQGFDTLVIDTKECKATITICKDAAQNRLKIFWT